MCLCVDVYSGLSLAAESESESVSTRRQLEPAQLSTRRSWKHSSSTYVSTALHISLLPPQTSLTQALVCIGRFRVLGGHRQGVQV
jgi:hypothetical protein